MRAETKLLKDKIMQKFPEEKVYVEYICAANYVLTSDKIKIRTTIPYQIIAAYISQNSKGIAIYPKGNIAFMSGGFTSEIFGVSTDAEFIEIETENSCHIL